KGLKATFRGLVVGTVLFTQLSSDPYSDVSVFLDLSYGQLSAPSTVNHNWHVHNYPISTETDNDKGCCLSTGGHWNPYNIDITVSAYAVNCAPDSPFACEYTDGNMPLSGPNSIIGRSLVIHYTNSSRLVPYESYILKQLPANQQLSCGLGVACGRTIHMVYSNE
uniref:Superoxide dismutase copper/zinc binding domain-containing protein n=1 Tax=Sinocyclocheilus anshuiensis TaxID=1608454 RepID=A0A671QDT6_9TELE